MHNGGNDFMNITKRHINIALLLMINLFCILIFIELIHEKKEMSFIIHNGTSFYGVPIPEDIQLYLVSGTYTLSADKTEMRIVGTYNNNNIITMLTNRNQSQQIATLMHEIAHYQYATKLNSDEKKTIHNWYIRVCDNENEFYAYAIGQGESMLNELHSYYDTYQN